MCFCVSRIFCVCLLVGLLKCSCCASKHTQNVEKFNSINVTDELIFLKHIFFKYGNNGSMNFDGFQELLRNLGLVEVFSASELKKHHEKLDHHHREDHEHEFVMTPKLDDGDNLAHPLPHESYNPDEISHIEKDSHQKDLIDFLNELSSGEFNESEILKLSSKNMCLSATETLYNYKLAQKPSLTSADFMYICPAIIFDLDRSSCLINKDHDHEHDHAQIIYKQPGVEVWLFAIGAVIIISLCGLFSVAMVPLIQRVFYQSVLQFLVGLAIGSLSGDSLLHLLPHAMAGLNHHDHQGSSSHGNGHGDHLETESHMWRGLVALLGIYAFYLAERLLTRFSSCYKKNAGERKESLPKNVARKPDKVPRKTPTIHKIDPEQSRTVGEKLSHHKHGSYGFNFDQLEMEDMQKLNESTKEDNVKSEYRSASDSEILGEKEIDMMDEMPTKAFSASLTSKSGKLDDSGASETLVMKKNGKDRSALMIAVRGNAASGSASSLHFHHSHHHHHHHHHSHLATPGNGGGTISSVAWMVIMGDGLHNFCDGLAIGAAFAAGLSSGISTTIAVFCHELPHELGDFAMLIKAGMSVRQALIYNGLSSILCFVGMIVGVLLGNVGTATLWVFAGAAGMFLYIALVDMLPELTTQEEENNGLFHLLLQALGISSGISIMLVIAIYEHDLRHLLS